MIDEKEMIKYRAKKIITLIQEVSALNGGDDEDFLNDYIAEVLKECSNNSEKQIATIACFEDLKAQHIKGVVKG